MYRYLSTDSFSDGNAGKLLQQPDLKRNGRAEKVDIMDSEDFYVVDVAKNKDTFVIKFEMPFILCVNGKFNIQSIAVGTLNLNYS